MTDTKPSDTKTDKSPSNATGSTTGGRGSQSGKSGRGGKGRGKGGNGQNKTQPSKPVVPKFDGMCKKDLAGKVIVYSGSRPSMAAQWIKFEVAVYTAAGRADPNLARALHIKKHLTLGDFLPPIPKESEYTIGQDKDGNPMYDTAKKALYDRAGELLVAKAVDGYALYLKNWKIFFFRIKGQIDPDTTARVEMSEDWADIKVS